MTASSEHLLFVFGGSIRGAICVLRPWPAGSFHHMPLAISEIAIATIAFMLAASLWSDSDAYFSSFIRRLRECVVCPCATRVPRGSH